MSGIVKEKIRDKTQISLILLIIAGLFVITNFLSRGCPQPPPAGGFAIIPTQISPIFAEGCPAAFFPQGGPAIIQASPIEVSGNAGPAAPRRGPQDFNHGLTRINTDKGDWLGDLIDKIRQVELGGGKNNHGLTRINTDLISAESAAENNVLTGDNGKAFGPLQIHQGVITDINRYYGANYRIRDTCDIESAKEIARLYITMWMEINREEIAARIFNGGPRGWRKTETDCYWAKIQKNN